MNTIDEINRLIDLAKKQMERPLSLRAAAQYLDCSKSFLYKMVSKKLISFHKVNSKLLYFTKKDLDAFVLSKRIKANDK